MSHIPQDAARRLVDKLGAAAAPHLEWRWVPVEATLGMVSAGRWAYRNGGLSAVSETWAAMLAAAPHPPKQAAPTDEEIASWADSFILAQAFNRPIAVQIAIEAAKWVRSRFAQPQAAERLYDAVTWALGANGEFRTQGTMDGPYWWRGELAERAGLKWNGERYVFDSSQPQAAGWRLPENATEPMQKAMQRAVLMRKSMNDVWRAALAEINR